VGGNFRNLLQSPVHQGRYFADVKITAGTRLDFDTVGDSYNYGETSIRIMMKTGLDSGVK
jgi:hypothetical protein